MKLTQFSFNCIQAFHQFRQSSNLDHLLVNLEIEQQKIKKELKYKGKNKSIWFRFYEKDTMATTLEDLKITLSGLRGQANKKNMEEDIDKAIKDASLEVYYS